MAGQPPEPSFQPSGQDPGATQGRPAWQPTDYPPPAGGAQQGYGAPEPSYPPQEQTYAGQDQAYAGQGQAQAAQGQGYAGQDKTYTSIGQGNARAQEYPGYQQPSYGAQPGPGNGTGTGTGAPPQWHGIPGVQPPPPKQHGEKGFLGSLFDFSFSSFVTPKIIKVLYVLLTLWTALIAIIILIVGFRTGGIGGGLVTLIIVDPIIVLLSLGLYRVVLEAFMVVFRLYEETKKIRENSESRP
jgi:Domain of unknown function (DUF4282)